MNYLANIVGIKMKVHKNYNRKVLKKAHSKTLMSILMIIMLSVMLFATSFGLAQETSTLTPVQTETNLTAQESTKTEDSVDITTNDLTPKDSSVITTTVTTTPISTSDVTDQTDNPESRVCDALGSQVISNLANYDNWEIRLDDRNGNVQGEGTMKASGLELRLFNLSAQELYLYFFTNAEAISIANSNALRISLFEEDVSEYSAGSDSRGIIINATIQDGVAQPINTCILPFEDVFPNYRIVN